MGRLVMKKSWEYYDYCHNSYVPVISPHGKLSSNVLLENSLMQSVNQKFFLSIIKRIKTAVGPWNTVWGIKLDGKNIEWELYFYNYGRKDPRLTATRILKVLRSFFKIPVFADIGIESQPYFTFSVDLPEGVLKTKQMGGVHLYTEGRDQVSQGNSYYWGSEGLSFENHYDFFRMPQEARLFVHKVKQSIFLAKDSTAFLKHDLVKRLCPCHKICVAHKKNKEGLYFSRVNVGQLLYFLEFFAYPQPIVNFVKTNEKRLDHLLYDVAFDCTLGPQGIVFGKSSYYNVF